MLYSLPGHRNDFFMDKLNYKDNQNLDRLYFLYTIIYICDIIINMNGDNICIYKILYIQILIYI